MGVIMFEHLTYGFIGLGLIGGSIAKALRSTFPGCSIYAYDPNEEGLSLSLKEGVSSRIFPEINGAFADCDYLFLCAPVACNARNLLSLKPYLKEGCTLTDVGSTKSDIHARIEQAGLTSRFIGGHPMTGSERFGYANSKAGLLENAYYILTPPPETPPEKLERFRELIASIGAIPLVLECGLHDYVSAGVSHLPHIIAASLVELVRESDGEDGIMKQIAAGGFKDITRIASSSPDMWKQICLANTDNISALLEKYIDSLTEIKSRLYNRDAEALYRFFDSARNYRDSFTEAGSGPIKRSYEITLDIPDEAGALAAIATILALNGISIKNIGIVHNREFEEGVLRIEFWEEASAAQAVSLLKTKGYCPHERR